MHRNIHLQIFSLHERMSLTKYSTVYTTTLCRNKVLKLFRTSHVTSNIQSECFFEHIQTIVLILVQFGFYNLAALPVMCFVHSKSIPRSCLSFFWPSESNRSALKTVIFGPNFPGFVTKKRSSRWRSFPSIVLILPAKGSLWGKPWQSQMKLIFVLLG